MHFRTFAMVSTASSLDCLASLLVDCTLETAPGVSIPLSEASVSDESAHSAISVNSNNVAATTITSSKSVSESEKEALFFVFFPVLSAFSSISVSTSDSGSYST